MTFYDPQGKAHRPTEKGVWRCIPRQSKPYVEGVEIDHQGIWVYLNEYAVESKLDCHTIHAHSFRELKQKARDILILPNPKLAFSPYKKAAWSEKN